MTELRASFHVPAHTRRTALTALAVLMYACTLHWAWSTAGEPHKHAKAELERIEREKNESIANGTAAAAAASKAVDFNSIDEESDEELPASIKTDTANPFGSLLAVEGNLIIDENATKNVTNATRPMPSTYLPSAPATFALFFSVVMHALFHLMCHWLFWFRAAALYDSAPEGSVGDGVSVLMQPPANHGKADLCAITKSTRTGRLVFTFQRQLYEIVTAEEAAAAEAAKENESGGESSSGAGGGASEGFEMGDSVLIPVEAAGGICVRLVQYPVSSAIKHYVGHAGLTSAGDDINSRTGHYGSNSLAIAAPRFIDLLQEQMLSPVSMFQIFTSILWMLDEYWQYVIFQLIMIIMLDCVTAFQRKRTMSTLDGMAMRPYPVNVFRDGRWSEHSSLDLLPGDLFSLKWATQDKGGTKAAAPLAVTGAAGEGSAAPAPPPAPPAPAPGAPVVGVNMNIIPCDCLLLKGTAVTNEATLTGESVPQMKDSLRLSADEGQEDEASKSSDDRALEVDEADRVHVLFSGTALVNSTQGAGAGAEAASAGKSAAAAAAAGPGSAGVPPTPDGGALCYALRTGFSSSQGELVRMIEFSTQSVSGDSREILCALAILFVFALVSAGYVLKKGLEKGDKTTHELMLKCVIIITSVVPRSLPMQMAMAVNTALMSLTKAGIFCTEPYRLPNAGKITHCLFDKTGTLTTDQLVPVGVVNHGHEGSKSAKIDPATGAAAYVPVCEASREAGYVLGACHALVHVDGAGLVGDPIEVAALRGVEWSYDHSSATCKAGNLEAENKVLESVQSELKGVPQGSAAHADASQRLEEVQAEIARKTAAAKANPTTVKILARHHFQSSLQRMSTVCDVKGSPGGNRTGQIALVKGSPEALKLLLAPGACPDWYDTTYRVMAERGMRVLALGYKWCPDSDVPARNRPRAWVESNLEFGGFIAFTCQIRSDSGTVMVALKDSGHSVAMLTGDAALTALYVATEIGICDKKGKETLLLQAPKTTGSSGAGGGVSGPSWRTAIGDPSLTRTLPFSLEDIQGTDVRGIVSLKEDYNLMTTEASLEATSAFLESQEGGGGGGGKKADAASSGSVWSFVEHFEVFARMTPQGKANVIQAIQGRKTRGAAAMATIAAAARKGGGSAAAKSAAAAKPDAAVSQTNFVLMCGDGGNDVGALKQADVGLALLSGYGNSNTTADGEGEGGEGGSGKELVSEEAEAKLNANALELAKKQADAARLHKELFAQKQKELQAKQMEWIQEELNKMTEAGEELGVMSHIRATKAAVMRMTRELQKANMELQAKHGNVYDSKDPAKAIEAMGSSADLPMIRPGDASVAAPFTSRAPSVKSVVDLIRQGRCTLLSALQQQQIMMLECMISAYTLSALSLAGSRSSERQMMASGWLLSTASLAFSYSSPLDRMHPLRPLRSLFHPTIFLSIVGQATLHIYCMVQAVTLATETMGPDALAEVISFNRKVRQGIIKSGDPEAGEDDPMAQMMSLWATPFKPNLMNTVVFLVETSQIIAVLFVNYKGRPWMKGVMENHPLFLSLFLCVAGVAACAWETVPYANKLAHLFPFPDDDFRWQVMRLVGASLVGTFVWDRLMTALFSPDIFAVIVGEGKKTSLADIKPIVESLCKVVIGFAVFGSGNPLIWMGSWWVYKQYNTAQAQAEEQAKFLKVEQRKKAKAAEKKDQ